VVNLFHAEKLHTSTSRNPVVICNCCWQTADVADFFTLTKYTLQLVESLVTYAIVVCNLRLHNKTLNPKKVPSSHVETGRHIESILFNNMEQLPFLITLT